jgi:hypothetical protein
MLGAILFEQTMDREVEGKYTGDYLADKGVVPFLKVDKGLAEQQNGVQSGENEGEVTTLVRISCTSWNISSSLLYSSSFTPYSKLWIVKLKANTLVTT